MLWDILMPALILAGIGFVLGILIFIVSKAFHVEEDPSIEEVVELLPRYNCGACGFPGCKEMASALLNNGAKPVLCKPLKKESLPALEEYLKNYFEAKKQQQ